MKAKRLEHTVNKAINKPTLVSLARLIALNQIGTILMIEMKPSYLRGLHCRSADPICAAASLSLMTT